MRVLAWLTVGVTYFLMVWGNFVSATGSGLGCPDWPTCHGTFTPTPTFEVVLEWGHRILAAVASTCIIATMVGSVFRKNSSPTTAVLQRSGKFLLALLGTQIVLGAITVLLGLSLPISTIHLLIANLVFGGLITVASVTQWGDGLDSSDDPKLRRLAVAALVGYLVQMGLGALVRHGHAGLACPLFPNCLDGFFPSPLSFETAVAFTHRWWGFLLLGVFVHLAAAASKRAPELRGLTRFALLLAVLQVVLGVSTVLFSLQTAIRGLHAAVGYGLWGALVFIALRTGALNRIWRLSAARSLD